jgi:hypothetical protein
MSQENSDNTGATSTNGSNAPPTLTYKYGSEEVTVDLSNPDQVKLAQDRLSKGHNMEKIAEERNKLREEAAKYKQQVDAWNERLESARTDSNEFSALVKDIEEYTGRKLTREQKTDLLEGDDIDPDDPVAKRLLKMEQRLAEAELKDQQREEQRKKDTEREYAQGLINKLDAMEADKENFPDFDREAVYEKARKSMTNDFEMVYHYLNRSKYQERLRKQIEDEFKTLTDKRKAAVTETDTTSASLQEPPKKYDKIEDVGKALLEEAKSGDLSFFTD